MILEQAKRLVNLTERLSETLMAAAICADDIRAILRAGLDGRGSLRWGRLQDTKPRNPARRRPLVDSSTFSVFWAGKTCPLRRTILFRLAERLARQRNQYITADQLLRDVWEGGIKSPETIRSAVRHLRQRLTLQRRLAPPIRARYCEDLGHIPSAHAAGRNQAGPTAR
jgi:DNA-binding response OmpR family regulator